MNPAGAILVLLGIFAVIVGVKGSQNKVFAALTGKSATGPAGGATGTTGTSSAWGGYSPSPGSPTQAGGVTVAQ